MIIEDDELVPKLERIHQYWPKLLDEYLSMIVRNRERQLERIVVTEEIRSRARDNAAKKLIEER